MPRKQSKPASAQPKRNPKIPSPIMDAIDRAWPRGIVEYFDKDESYFWDLQDKLERKLRSIKGANITFERPAKGETEWSRDEFGDEDLPLSQEEDRSFHLYFLVPSGDEFRYKVEQEPMFMDSEEDEALEVDENGLVKGEGHSGFAVGISLVAPIGI